MLQLGMVLRWMVPSYSWGGITGGVASYKIDQVLQTVKEVYARRNKLLEDDDMNIIRFHFANDLNQLRWRWRNTGFRLHEINNI